MIGVAVVGAGNWGKNLVRNFASVKGGQLKYVVDLSEKTRAAMSAAYPKACVTDDSAKAFADPAVGAVVIAVDAPFHFKIAQAALQAGKHVYVEKPLTLSSVEAKELVDLALAKKVQLMVGHLLEYHPAVNYMKDMIDKGAIGQPLYLYFQRLNLGIVRKQENAWWSLAPHDVSVACYLFGSQPVSVSASGQAYLQKGIEDVVFANLKFADGRMAHIHVSWLDPHKIRKVTLVGSDKMVVFDDMEASEKIRVHDKSAGAKKAIDSYVEAITLRTGDILIPAIKAEEPLKVECQHFMDSVVNNTTPRSDGQDGLRVVKVLEAGSESLRQGGAPINL
jgi:predicted dehydrogenase